MGAERLLAADRLTSDELLDITGAVKAEAGRRPLYAGVLPGRKVETQGGVLHVHLRGKTGAVESTFVVSRSKRSLLEMAEPPELVRRCMVWLRQRERGAVFVSPSLPMEEAA
jgi:hypothetical protein